MKISTVNDLRFISQAYLIRRVYSSNRYKIQDQGYASKSSKLKTFGKKDLFNNKKVRNFPNPYPLIRGKLVKQMVYQFAPQVDMRIPRSKNLCQCEQPGSNDLVLRGGRIAHMGLKLKTDIPVRF